MKLTYQVTEEIYAQVIEYQMKLNFSRPVQKIKYIGLNLVFGAFAVYFAVDRSAYSVWIRFAPLLMALILFALSTWKRTNLSKRAGQTLKRLIASNTLEKEFLGTHTLIFEEDKLRRGYGKNWAELTGMEISGYEQLPDAVILFGKGMIFEIIPNAVLDKNDNRSRFHEEIRRLQMAGLHPSASEESESLPADHDYSLTWHLEQEEYIRGMVQGHRSYYRTLQAWKGRQTVRIVVLLYGVVLLALRLNFYLGAAFLLIGILLNRQLFLTFSPLSTVIVRNQLIRILGDRTDMGEETFYTAGKEFGAVCMGQVQRGSRDEILSVQNRYGYLFIYTGSAQMYVIPDRACSDTSEKTRLLKQLGA